MDTFFYLNWYLWPHIAWWLSFPCLFFFVAVETLELGDLSITGVSVTCHDTCVSGLRVSALSNQSSSLSARKATAQIAFVFLASGSRDPFQSQNWHVHWADTSLVLVYFRQKAKRWLLSLYFVSWFSSFFLKTGQNVSLSAQIFHHHC